MNNVEKLKWTSFPLLRDLPTFPEPLPGLRTDEQISFALKHSAIRRVSCFSLGPEGTNIAKATRTWLSRMGIERKACIHLTASPEEAIEGARETSAPGQVGVFWTCAVYYRENDIFFENPDLLPFFSQELMALDAMQLAARPDSLQRLRDNSAEGRLCVASHPSPVGLLRGLDVRILTAFSNADAARRCAAGEADACVTTEAARKAAGLVQLHVFGSPDMVFFAGITRRGAEALQQLVAPLPPSLTGRLPLPLGAEEATWKP